MKSIRVHKIHSKQSGDIDFKICAVNFDKACEIEEDIDPGLFNVIWIKEGSGTYSIDFRTYDFNSGLMFFLTPQQIFRVNSEKIVEGYWLSFSQDFYCVETRAAESSCNGLLFNNVYETPFIKLGAKESGYFEGLLEHIFEEFNEPDVDHEHFVDAYLKLFLIKATRIKAKGIDLSPMAGFKSENNITSNFSALVEKHFKEVHAITDYAELLNISPKALSKQLKSSKNRTPSDIVRDRIILEAKRDLFYSDKSIKEIGYDLGFNDPAYFNRFFTKSTDMPPKRFRENRIRN